MITYSVSTDAGTVMNDVPASVVGCIVLTICCERIGMERSEAMDTTRRIMDTLRSKRAVMFYDLGFKEWSNAVD